MGKPIWGFLEFKQKTFLKFEKPPCEEGTLHQDQGNFQTLNQIMENITSNFVY